MVDHTIVVTDTSVLINFLAIDQVALMVAIPNRRFAITNHVRNEVPQHFPHQLARLENAIDSSQLLEIVVVNLTEVALFAGLTSSGLGVGECSAIAVAANRGYAIAIDDRAARRRIS